MRKEVPEVGWGEFEVLKTGDPAVLGVRYDWRNNSVLFLHNFAKDPREIEFLTGIKGETGDSLVNLLTADHSRAGGTANIAFAWKVTVIAGIALAAWTICSNGRNFEQHHQAFIRARTRYVRAG